MEDKSYPNEDKEVADQATKENQKRRTIGDFLSGWLERGRFDDTSEEDDEEENPELKNSFTKRWSRSFGKMFNKLVEKIPATEQSQKEELAAVNPTEQRVEEDEPFQLNEEETTLQYEDLDPHYELTDDKLNGPNLNQGVNEEVIYYKDRETKPNTKKASFTELIPTKDSEKYNPTNEYKRGVRSALIAFAAAEFFDIRRVAKLRRKTEANFAKQNKEQDRIHQNVAVQQQEIAGSQLRVNERIRRLETAAPLITPNIKTAPFVVPSTERERILNNQTRTEQTTIERPRLLEPEKTERTYRAKEIKTTEIIKEPTSKSIDRFVPRERFYEKQHETIGNNQSRSFTKYTGRDNYFKSTTASPLSKILDSSNFEAMRMQKNTKTLGEPSYQGKSLYKQAALSGFWTALILLFAMFIIVLR